MFYKSAKLSQKENAGKEENNEGMGSSEEEEEEKGARAGREGGREIEEEIDPRAEERELKKHLLKKYSGYLSSLKQELSKKKKKGKLPKEARAELLRWWELHNKWPYPSVTSLPLLLVCTQTVCENVSKKKEKKKVLNVIICRKQRSWGWQNQQGWIRNR